MHMKLSKFLLLGLLGICVPLTMATSCSDNKEPDDPAVVPHHPTSNFDRCPLLAHIDNPKLGIKEITLERYEDGELAYKEVYSYDKEQRLTKITADNWYNTYEYDAKGRLSKYTEMSTSGVWGYTHTLFYDEYGFLAKHAMSGQDEGTPLEIETIFTYNQDTALSNEDGYVVWRIYSEDMYMTTYWNNGWFVNYEWEKGNSVMHKSSNGNEQEYTYDNKVNIDRLLNGSPMYIEWYMMNENNRLINGSAEFQYEYTYDDKGMVTTRQHGASKNVYTYIYY